MRMSLAFSFIFHASHYENLSSYNFSPSYIFFSRFLIQFIHDASWICLFTPSIFHFTIAWIIYIYICVSSSLHTWEIAFVICFLTKMDTKNSEQVNSVSSENYCDFDGMCNLCKDDFKSSKIVLQHQLDFHVKRNEEDLYSSM